MNHILEVQGLIKRYPAFSLDNISFSLPEGCVTGFIGANGAGKTTTIRSILKLARRDGGEIKIFGQDMDKHEREIKDRIGIYSIIASVCAKLDLLNITEALIVFLAGAILHGIFTPVSIKYGITQGRLVFTVAVLLLSLGPTLVVRVFHPDMKAALSILQQASTVTGPIVLALAGIAVFLFSMMISIRIFERKEL